MDLENFENEGDCKELFSAWFRAKSELGSTIMPEGKNPYYKNDYVQLDTLFLKIDPVCKKHKLGIIQFPTGTGLVTILFHEPSGQFIRSNFELILEKKAPQGVGSALTYAKRQVCQALFGLSPGKDDPMDDDGNLATHGDIKGELSEEDKIEMAKKSLSEVMSLAELEQWKLGEHGQFLKEFATGDQKIKINKNIKNFVDSKLTELKLLN